MKTLFSLDSAELALPAIEGFSYHREYLSRQLEQELVTAIDGEPWNTAWQRRRQLYGASYGKAAGVPRPLPFWSVEIAERMVAEKITEQPFDQMLVNEYWPGQGISLHRDYETFDDTIVSLSLLSEYVMDFKHPATGQREAWLLERRSLLVLSGPARYEWQHGIANRKNDHWQGNKISRGRRLSVTFRSVKKP